MKMTLLDSNYKKLIPVDLPFSGKSVYMHPIEMDNPQMPSGFEGYLKPVQSLLESLGLCKFSETAFVTVDEKYVEAGLTQRRPKPHIDGKWIPSLYGHGGHGGG